MSVLSLTINVMIIHPFVIELHDLCYAQDTINEIMLYVIFWHMVACPVKLSNVNMIVDRRR